MEPWFIATETFGPDKGDAWLKYISWSGLNQLDELVTLDPILCPAILPVIKPEYWPHIVNEDFMLNFFVDFGFLMQEVMSISRKNILCVFRNPPTHPVPPADLAEFKFLGYDLVDVQGDVSALTNCGGFPEVFAHTELSSVGLLPDHARALEVQRDLKRLYAEDHHAHCHVWAVFRAVGF